MKKAVILLSGGLDSATCLAIAKHRGFECHCLSFDYGQRHRAELAAACRLSDRMEAKDFRIISIDLRAFGSSALTDSAIAVPTEGLARGVIPVTYVPARNTIFLSYALACAEVLDTEHIFIGANAIDYSNYPDCRPEYISAFQAMARLATRRGVEGGKCNIHTPLILLSKAQIICRGIELGIDYSETVSCYQADDEGRACRVCDACRLRAAGFEKAGVADPTRYQNQT